METKMNNETEFILSPDLTKGFTVLSNEVYDYLSDNAVGLYGRIIMKANIPGWKVYQSTLINDLNKRASVSKAMKELIEVGYIEKTQIRNEKGHIKGVKYVVHSSPIKKEINVKNNVEHENNLTPHEKMDNVKTVENTNVQPNVEKPISVLPISVKRQLKNKDNKKIKNIKNKDKTTTIEKSENIDIKKTESKNSSSSSDIKINLDIKGITKTNIKRLKLNQEQIDLLEEYVLNNDCDDLDKFSYFVAKSIKNGEITKDSLKTSKSHKVNKQVSSNNDVTLFRETREKQLEDYNNAIEDDFDNLTL